MEGTGSKQLKLGETCPRGAVRYNSVRFLKSEDGYIQLMAAIIIIPIDLQILTSGRADRRLEEN